MPYFKVRLNGAYSVYIQWSKVNVYYQKIAAQ